VLAQRLRHLEREGVVDRQVADDGPPSLVRALPRWFRLRP
jgi:DNA-binding HxlR family transcriptional regulator